VHRRLSLAQFVSLHDRREHLNKKIHQNYSVFVYLPPPLSIQRLQHHLQITYSIPILRPATRTKCYIYILHTMDLRTPSLPEGPTLSLTTNSSWLPWGRGALWYKYPNNLHHCWVIFKICKLVAHFICNWWLYTNCPPNLNELRTCFTAQKCNNKTG